MVELTLSGVTKDLEQCFNVKWEAPHEDKKLTELVRIFNHEVSTFDESPSKIEERFQKMFSDLFFLPLRKLVGTKTIDFGKPFKYFDKPHEVDMCVAGPAFPKDCSEVSHRIECTGISMGDSNGSIKLRNHVDTFFDRYLDKSDLFILVLDTLKATTLPFYSNQHSGNQRFYIREDEHDGGRVGIYFSPITYTGAFYSVIERMIENLSPSVYELSNLRKDVLSHKSETYRLSEWRSRYIPTLLETVGFEGITRYTSL